MEVKTNNALKCSVALTGLYDVYDPEIGLNVIDLGLIYEINFDEDDQKIVTTMTLTTPFCPMGEHITSDVTQSLTKAFLGSEVILNLTFDPPWSLDHVSPEGLRFLKR